MRILVLSQYPIYPAIHGGQKRTAAIVAFYKKKHSVTHVAISWPDTYKEQSTSPCSKQFVVTDKRLLTQLQLHPERADLLLGQSLSTRSKISRDLRSIIESFNPDFIHIEQPYLVTPVNSILREVTHRPIVVYGSQNVEYLLKEAIYQHILSRKDLRYLLSQTKSTEDAASKIADINLGVSRIDIETLRQRADVWRPWSWVLVGNGTDQIANSIPKDELHTSQSKIVFIGSAHPPNYIGIEELLYDTRFLGKNNVLWLIGGVANYFYEKYEKDDLFWVGKIATGQVDEKNLQTHIEQADIIVLPINTGGGSNLKTVEAIYARKKIVSTTFAFRGFEQYKTFPNVYIADTPDEFKDSILRALSSEYQQYTEDQRCQIRYLVWDRALRPLNWVISYARLLLLIGSAKTFFSGKAKGRDAIL